DASTRPANPVPGNQGRSPFAKAFRSMPAQKLPPAPVRMATRRSGRSSSSVIARSRPRATDMSTALRAAGLEIVTIHNGPSAKAVTEGGDGDDVFIGGASG